MENYTSDSFVILFDLSHSAPSSFIIPPVEMRQKALLCHQSFQHAEGDHFTLINIYNAYKYANEGSCECICATNTYGLYGL